MASKKRSLKADTSKVDPWLKEKLHHVEIERGLAEAKAHTCADTWGKLARRAVNVAMGRSEYSDEFSYDFKSDKRCADSPTRYHVFEFGGVGHPYCLFCGASKPMTEDELWRAVKTSRVADTNSGAALTSTRKLASRKT